MIKSYSSFISLISSSPAFVSWHLSTLYPQLTHSEPAYQLWCLHWRTKDSPVEAKLHGQSNLVNNWGNTLWSTEVGKEFVSAVTISDVQFAEKHPASEGLPHFHPLLRNAPFQSNFGAALVDILNIYAGQPLLGNLFCDWHLPSFPWDQLPILCNWEDICSPWQDVVKLFSRFLNLFCHLCCVEQEYLVLLRLRLLVQFLEHPIGNRPSDCFGLTPVPENSSSLVFIPALSLNWLVERSVNSLPLSADQFGELIVRLSCDGFRRSHFFRQRGRLGDLLDDCLEHGRAGMLGMWNMALTIIVTAH